ncbi:MAG: O-antigen ligase family protein [Thermodesulfobacteriota bacterium]
MNAITNIINYIVLIIIFLLLVISPLPYGSVEEWAKLLIQLEAFFLLFLLVIYLFFVDKGLKISRSYNKLFALLFFLLIILQIIPIPGTILKLLSYESYDIWSTNDKILTQVGLPQNNRYYTISLYPYGTFTGLLQLLAYFSIGLTVSFFCNNRNRVTYLIYLIFLVAFLEATIGFYQSIFLGNLSTGTYINKNHFAGFIELTSFLLIGYSLSLRNSESKNEDYRSYFKKLLSSDQIYKQLTVIITISYITIAIFLSQSRMAIFSFMLTAVLMFLLVRRFSKDSQIERILIGFGIFMTLAYTIFISFYPLFKRFIETIGEAPGRTHIWSDSIRIFLDFPIFGTGLDTFKYIYAKYKTIEIASSINFAHNDYLQLLVETGIIGFLLVLILLYKFIKYSIEKIGLYSKKGDFCAADGRLGGLCGIISILIHSLVDFNLHIPANAVYFSFLFGIIFSDFDSGINDNEESVGQ